jgi:polyphenol oxidase
VAAVLDRWGALQADLPGIRGVAVGRQVHGTRVAWQAAGPGLRILADTDGHATATPGLLLAVTAADCVPVFLLDPVRRVVGLLHAGWRGTAGGILARGLGVLGENGSRVSDVLIHLGPSICGDCYEVGSEVFEACGTPVPPAGRGGLDLRAVLADQARGCGAAGVSVSPFCTAHHADRFFSHRGSGGEPGRMAAYLGLGLPV